MALRVSRPVLCLLMLLGSVAASGDASAQGRGVKVAPPVVNDDLPVTQSPRTTPESVEDNPPIPQSSAAEENAEEDAPYSDVPPPSRAVFSDADCSFEDWVGKKVDEAAVKKTGRPYRILSPDSMMTMDHSPQRINIVHDKDGTVTRVWCG